MPDINRLTTKVAIARSLVRRLNSAHQIYILFSQLFDSGGGVPPEFAKSDNSEGLVLAIKPFF